METKLSFNENLKPYILRYTSFDKYLTAYFNYRKNEDSKFSYYIWSAELGFKSRSYIQMLSKGKKNATHQFINIFSQKMQFSKKETEHLTALALHHSAKSLTQKKFFFDKILENLETPESIVDIKNNVTFLSSPYLTLLHLILAFEDFKATEKNLKLFFNLSSAEIKNGLQLLEKMELIQPVTSEAQKDVRWIAKSKGFKASDLHHEDIFKLYHLESLKQAEKSLQEDQLMKKFKSIYFSLDDENFAGFSEEVDAFLRRMKLKYGSDTLNNKRVFKVNIQGYPLTEKFEAE